MRVAAAVELTKGERRRLAGWASARSTSVRLRERARMVLMAAEGKTNKAIAAELGVDENKRRSGMHGVVSVLIVLA